MAAYEYRFKNYSFQDSSRTAAAHTDFDAMVADGWHVHTANMNFVEAAILWERGGSASADRVQSHFEETGVLPAKRSRKPAPPDGE